jgi:hypothetical protein
MATQGHALAALAARAAWAAEYFAPHADPAYAHVK